MSTTAGQGLKENTDLRPLAPVLPCHTYNSPCHSPVNLSKRQVLNIFAQSGTLSLFKLFKCLKIIIIVIISDVLIIILIKFTLQHKTLTSPFLKDFSVVSSLYLIVPIPAFKDFLIYKSN